MLYGDIKNYSINNYKITKQPSEDKYSIAPLKIVGFLPKEAGEAIVLPYEITLITGSDKCHCFYQDNIKNCVNCWKI